MGNEKWEMGGARRPVATRAVLVVIALLGILMVGLSFAPWVKFEGTVLGGLILEVSISIPGTEIGRVVGGDYEQPADVADQLVNPCSCRGDSGDGYITAVLGAIVAAAAVAGLVWQRAFRPATLVIALASLGVLVVAGWNAVTEWQAVGAPNLETDFTLLDGETLPALWALTAAAAVSAVLCGVLWALAATEAPEEDMLQGNGEGEMGNGAAEGETSAHFRFPISHFQR